jgi:hypothetical protein
MNEQSDTLFMEALEDAEKVSERSTEPNRNVERVFDPSRKDTHWGKRKLKRDE